MHNKDCTHLDQRSLVPGSLSCAIDFTHVYVPEQGGLGTIKAMIKIMKMARQVDANLCSLCLVQCTAAATTKQSQIIQWNVLMVISSLKHANIQIL